MWHSSQKNDVNSPCVLLAYDLCPQHFLSLSIFSVLDNFCQIASLHSNAVWMTRVLHLICKAHTRILLFGAKFHILAMYVQMLVDIYQKYQKNLIFLIFSTISRYFPTLMMLLLLLMMMLMDRWCGWYTETMRHEWDEWRGAVAVGNERKCQVFITSH